jgi:hypothetical protein
MPKFIFHLDGKKHDEKGFVSTSRRLHGKTKEEAQAKLSEEFSEFRVSRSQQAPCRDVAAALFED